MNRLEYHFDCLDGRYFCVCEYDDFSFAYNIETSLPGFENKQGILKEDEAVLFKEKVNRASIESWDKHYGVASIEDGIKWKVKYIKEDMEYVSDGYETYEPYGYEAFMEALGIIEDKAAYFMAGVKDE